MFAAKIFPAGCRITAYHGERISRQEALCRRANGLDSHIARGGPFTFHSPYIDGVRAEQLQDGMPGGSACNHKPSTQANAQLVFLENPERTVVEAINDIGVDEEIFVCYGKDYWDARADVEEMEVCAL